MGFSLVLHRNPFTKVGKVWTSASNCGEVYYFLNSGRIIRLYHTIVKSNKNTKNTLTLSDKKCRMWAPVEEIWLQSVDLV